MKNQENLNLKQEYSHLPNKQKSNQSKTKQ